MTDRVLPTGTVTFLFSDIEGSTRLVQDLGPAVFSTILERHNALVREAVARHDGVERGTQGDSFLVMFREAPAAVAAAVETQRSIHEEPWPEGVALRVRMGLHTGLGTLGGDDYVSVDVHRAARIAGLARGGQVLLSDSSRALADGALPSGVTIRSLGEQRLRDLARPERIHQLVIDGLPSEFPALPSGERPAGNLPAPLTSFVGRESELAEATALIADHRLVTLTGPGGTGKTRLALEVGRAIADRFADGAWFVPLEAVQDPALVPAAIATTFSLLEAPGSRPIERVRDFLADRSLLLVLDNFEHLLEAAPSIGDLVRTAPGLNVLVTSRAPLRLSMEQELAVRPLGVPDRPEGADALSSEAVRLFVERAGRVRSGFEPSPDDVGAVVEICRRLDGLPLGIELAAARIGLLTPAAIAERLAGRLDLPGLGTRDLPERQRTLDATIGWSHDLLGPRERRLLARMSVFAGGARLEEIEAVAGDDDVLEALSALVDHRLVEPVPAAAGPRFRLLETIRMYAATRLRDAGESAEVRRRHAEAYLDLAEEAARHMPGGGQVPWLERLAVEHGNTRAALDWALEAGRVQIAHRLVAALWRYWQFRGHMAEGIDITTRVLAMPGADEPSMGRLRALEAAGGLAWWVGDVPTADSRYAEQLAVGRQVGDRQGIADALFNLSHTRFDPAGGHASEVDALRAEAARLYTELGDEGSLARVEWVGGYSLMAAGQFDEARVVAETALERFERGNDVFYGALAAAALAGIAMAKGDFALALRLGLKSVRAQLSMGDTASATLALQSAAMILLAAGLAEEAAMAAGAFDGYSRRYGYGLPLDIAGWLTAGMSIGRLQEVLGAPELAPARARGTGMTIEELVALLEDLDRRGVGPFAPRDEPADERPEG